MRKKNWLNKESLRHSTQYTSTVLLHLSHLLNQLSLLHLANVMVFSHIQQMIAYYFLNFILLPKILFLLAMVLLHQFVDTILFSLLLEFPSLMNLFSISFLTKYSYHCIIFFPTQCTFSNMRIKAKVVGGHKCDGLYFLFNQPSLAYFALTSTFPYQWAWLSS